MRSSSAPGEARELIDRARRMRRDVEVGAIRRRDVARERRRVRRLLLDRDDYVQAAAAEALGELGGRGALLALRAVYRGWTVHRLRRDSPAAVERPYVGAAIGLVKLGPAGEKVILRGVGQGELRTEASLIAFGYAKSSRSLELLRRYLVDGSHAMRCEAAKSLGLRGDGESIPALQAMASSGTSVEAAYARAALETFEGGRSWESLERWRRYDGVATGGVSSSRAFPSGAR